MFSDKDPKDYPRKPKSSIFGQKPPKTEPIAEKTELKPEPVKAKRAPKLEKAAD
jgi:hypothetical protein